MRLAAVVFGLTFAAQGAAAQTCELPTLAPGVPYAVARVPGVIAAADFDVDGAVDLAVGSSGSHQPLSVLLNNGDGTFAPARGVPIGYGIKAMLPADFNEDGAPDLVGIVWAAPPTGSASFILIGDGEGGFSAGGTFPSQALAVEVATGDFDEDGNTDFVVGTDLPGIVIRLGDGAGGFGEPAGIPMSHGIRNLIASDFDHDGHLDIAMVGPTAAGGRIEVIPGNGDGTFRSGIVSAEGSSFSGLTSLGVGDFDNDGHLDIVGRESATTLSLLLGDGAGSFGMHGTIGVDTKPWSVQASDLTGDGNLDLVVTATHRMNVIDGVLDVGVVDVLAGDGSGGFGTIQRFPITGDGAGSAVVADYDGDGRDDVAASDDGYPYGRVNVLRNVCGSVVDISASLAVAKPLVLSRPAAYAIAVENRGPDTAYALTVDIEVDRPVLMPRALTGACLQVSDERFTCTVGDIPAFQTGSVTLTARPQELGVASVYVYARSGGVDPTPGDQVASDSTTVQILGGEDVLLRAPDAGGVQLQWADGDAESGYYVVRRVESTTTVLPGEGTPLPASTASFIDPAPVPGSTNCYVVVPIDASGAFLGRSDMPCLQPATASASSAPSNPAVEVRTLRSSPGVEITWGGVAGATGYIVRTFAADGETHWQGTTETSRRLSIIGASSCYVVFAMDGETPLGNSHALCAVADVGNIPQ